jgi:uncharacterized protein YjbJ (UPF0337 family)
MGAGSGEMNYDPNDRDIEEAARQARMAASAATDSENDPNAVRADIERTRADLGETVNAIQERLNPQRIRDEAVSTVREATVGRVEDVAEDAKWKVKGAGYNVLDTIKRNPVPAALAAIGLGWLFMEARGNGGQYDRKMYRDSGRYYGGQQSRRQQYGGQYGSQYGDRYAYRSTQSGSTDYGYYPSYEEQGRMEQAGNQAREAVSNVGERASDAVDQARERVGDMTSRVGEQAGQFADQAQQTAQQAAEEMQYRAQMVKGRFGEMLEDNPLLIGAAALAVGAAVGFAFPSTQKENELFGEARDNLMESAQGMASDTMQKVQRVAEETADAAKDAARDAAQKQNLTGSPSSGSK